ncbi:MAG: cation diffusion facilitator family transporter [Chitinophagales bacterium]
MSSNQKIRFQWLTIIIGIALMGGKFIAFYITSSNIILSDALESIVNIATGSFGLYSLYLAAKPKDEDHPYGHGKIEFISAGLEGGLITLAGFGILLKSIYNLFYPDELNNLDIGLGIVVIAGLLNWLIGFYAEKIGKANNSMTLIASGKHLKTDAYSTVGMLIGLGLIMLTNWNWLDNIIAILIGVIIIYSGIKIVRASVGGIMDEADFSLLEEVVEHLEEKRQDNWIDVHNLRIIKYGDSVHIDCHVTLPWYYTVEEGHDEIETIEKLIDEKLPNNLESFIHIDPCIKTSCSVCHLSDCKERREPYHHTVKWTLENVMLNKKHGKKQY